MSDTLTREDVQKLERLIQQPGWQVFIKYLRICYDIAVNEAIESKDLDYRNDKLAEARILRDLSNTEHLRELLVFLKTQSEKVSSSDLM